MPPTMLRSRILSVFGPEIAILATKFITIAVMNPAVKQGHLLSFVLPRDWPLSSGLYGFSSMSRMIALVGLNGLHLSRSVSRLPSDQTSAPTRRQFHSQLVAPHAEYFSRLQHVLKDFAAF